MTHHTPYYRYGPLPTSSCIRLLDVHPSSKGDDLVVSLNTVFLPDNPLYEALSYVWGDPNVTRDIICEGTYLRITVNLHDALSQLRLPNKPRTLWVDALCINQSDLDEKSSQIQMMHQIYKSCQTCVVWLGLPDQYSDVALDVMRDVSNTVCQRVGVSPDELEVYLQVHGPDPSQAAEIGFHSDLPDHQSRRWQSVAYFLGRPWFSRTWVIQEAHFSPNVIFHCGERVTTYSDLYYAADWLMTNSTVMDSTMLLSGAFGADRFNVMKMRANNHKRDNQSLTDLLSGTCLFNATDPRDKVYGLMHLPAFQREYPDLIPNYYLTVEELYTDVAFQLIARNQNLYPLTHIGKSAKPSGIRHSLPSWVPDWRKENGDRRSVSPAWYQYFSAGTFGSVIPAMAMVRKSGNALSLRGIEFDTVQDVCSLKFSRSQDPDHLRVPVFSPVAPWAAYRPEAPDAPYPTKPAVVTAYALALTSGCRAARGVFPLRCAGANVPHHEGDFVAWLSWLRTLPSPSPSDGDGDGDGPYPPGLYARDRPNLPDTMVAQAAECAKRYGSMPPIYMLDRALIRTRHGFLGNASFGVRRGDMVSILLGGAVPFVIRPDGTDGGFTLVGDAYVHGIMDGECLTDWASVEPRLRDFVLH